MESINIRKFTVDLREYRKSGIVSGEGARLCLDRNRSKLAII